MRILSFCVILMVIIGLVMGVGTYLEVQSKNQAPPPFQKVKEIALTVKANEDGVHGLFMDIQDEGVNYKFVFAYFPNGIIGIGVVSPDVLVAEYNEKTNTFSVYYRNQRIAVEKDKVIGLAYQFFRVYVKEKFI